MGNQTIWPISSGERSTLLDALRGWALLGILVANMIIFTGFPFMDDAAHDRVPLAAMNDITEFLVEWLVIGKFYSLFSLLFGIGFAIQIGRLEQRGEGPGRYLRRLAILFLIGLGHLLLLWMGDIVALYALMGFFLLLFRKASDRALVLWAIALWLVPLPWSAMIHFAGIDPSGPLFGYAFALISSLGIDVSQGPLDFYRTATPLEHLRAHPAELFIRVADLLYQMRPAKVLGMFLIGLWVGRHAVFARLDEYRPLLRRTARLGLALGLPLSAAKAVFAMWPGDSRPPVEFAAELFYVLGTPTLALGYAAAFALLWARGARGVLQWPAAAGRMALTNYLMQSVLQSVLFYGWGIGLVGEVGLAFIVPISLALFAFQLAYSGWWLARFRFGPVEWLWRSLTYGRAQPMRRASN